MNILKSSVALIMVLFFISGCVTQDQRYEKRQQRILKKIDREVKKEDDRIKRNSVAGQKAQKVNTDSTSYKRAPKIYYDK